MKKSSRKAGVNCLCKNTSSSQLIPLVHVGRCVTVVIMMIQQLFPSYREGDKQISNRPIR